MNLNWKLDRDAGIWGGGSLPVGIEVPFGIQHLCPIRVRVRVRFTLIGGRLGSGEARSRLIAHVLGDLRRRKFESSGG